MKPGSSHGSSATRLHHVQGGSTCQQAREREGDGANWANSSELRGGKSLLSPTRTSPREKHSPPLPNRRSGASACQTSASGFHLQRERERDGRGWKNPAAISWCARGGRAAVCHRGRWAGVKVHQLSQGAVLCTLGGWQPSSPGLSSSSSPRAPVIAWEIAGPVHSKVREGEKWFLKDGNFSCQGRMPRQGLISMTKGPLQGYERSKIHNKFDCHCLGRAWHCGTSFRGSVFHPPRTGEGPATEESQNLQDGKWESLTQLVGGGALQRLLPNLLNRLKIDFSCFG